MDHSESNIARKALIDEQSQTHLEQHMQHERVKMELAQEHRRESMTNRKEVQDHSEHVHQVKQELEQLHDSIVLKQSRQELDKHSTADSNRRASLTKIKQSAHASNESVNRVQARKELYDKLDESESHRKSHELELKHELVEANRVDYLEGVKEKQAHLQGH
jgi:hypothetical protein